MSKIKVIQMDFSTGHKYQIPLSIIAEHRTNCYADKDGFAVNSEEYSEEMEFVMNDSFEGIDWLQNNMDWDDVKEHAVLVQEDTAIDFSEELCNCEKEIISV